MANVTDSPNNPNTTHRAVSVEDKNAKPAKGASIVQMVPTGKIIMHRKNQDGSFRRFIPQIGKVHEFTTDEVKQIRRVNKDALRDPMNESTTGGRYIPGGLVPLAAPDSEVEDAPEVPDADSLDNSI